MLELLPSNHNSAACKNNKRLLHNGIDLFAVNFQENSTLRVWKENKERKVVSFRRGNHLCTLERVSI